MRISRRRSCARADSSRRGNAAFTVLSALVLMGFAALTVDMGQARKVRAELQLACDAAAHAGTLELDGTATGIENARSTAVSTAALNFADNRSVALDGQTDITFGYWDGTSFTPESDPAVINAVQARSQRSDIDAIFGFAAFGITQLGAGAISVAVKPDVEPASSVNCFLPLAIPSCLLETYDWESGASSSIMDVDLLLNPAGADNVGWAALNSSPNANYVKSQFEDCSFTGEVKEGDMVGLANGQMTSGLAALHDAMESSSTSWDEAYLGPLPERMQNSSMTPANYGNTFEGTIMIFEAGPEYCTGEGSYTGYEPLVGFAWGMVYDVRTHGPAAERTLKLRIDVARDHIEGSRGDGEVDAGIDFQPPPMFVQ